jgi:cholesterol oxidase
MKRIARPLGEMADHYDAVVVGSGYGGGIAASRLARMGYRVALLERGVERLPGQSPPEFPDTPAEAAHETQVHTPDLSTGRATALFDFRVGKEMNVLIGCGLGGTSLINANVALEADPRVFDDPVWPIRFPDADLTRGYERARAMLRPQPYPDAVGLNKLRAMERSAEAFGVPLDRPPINVAFESGHNEAGVWQRACNFCGDCCSGCNVGAKTTTQMTYLPDADANGAEIYCGASVRSVERDPKGGWIVHYTPQDLGREAFGDGEVPLRADRVILAAGTLGSTEILLRSRARGLPLSAALGSRFSGNGDVLAFGYNNDQPIDGIGMGTRAQAYDYKVGPERPIGPTITGLIDLRARRDGASDLDAGMVIEEGAIPGGIGALMPAVMALTAGAIGTDTDDGDSLAERAREAESLARGPYHGAVNHTQTYLVMSHDGAQGTMRLTDHDRLAVDWPGVGDRPGFRHVADNLQLAVSATGGTYVPNPIWTPILGHALVTVHPLGGCPMGRNAQAGVVDADCRVFIGESGEAIHPGLYVCDGAVVPRSLGVNPLLTISAIAERAMIRLAERESRTIDMAPVEPQPDEPAPPPVIGISFTERMIGTVVPAGGGIPCEAWFEASVVADDAERFIAEAEHEADLIGTCKIAILSTDPMRIEGGRFNLFTEDRGAVETRQMIYKMPLVAEDGRRFFVAGKKTIHDDHHFDLWADTTTLAIEVRQGADETGAILHTGTLRIRAADFLRQLSTMKVAGATSLGQRAAMLTRFGRLFAGALFDTYCGALAAPDLYDPDATRVRRKLRVGPAEVHAFETADGKGLKLTRYKGGTKGPVILSHGLGVSSLIFSIDTIHSSMLEALYAAGYDCWLLDYRASIDLPYVRDQFTADDVADKDYPAAIAKVMAVTGAADVQIVAHCYGAMSLAMALLGGLKHVRSVVISQIAAHADVPFFVQRLLAYFRAPDLMKALGVTLLDARAEKKRNFLARAIDTFLRFLYPMHPDDRTRSITSLRIVALYGPLYRLDRLNQATLDAMPEMFGKSNIAAFRQLARIARAGHVVRSDGLDLLGEGNLRNWAIPTLFVHGAMNRAFLPTGTQKTMAALTAANGADLYERVEIPATGHIDCIFGKDAAETVFPAIIAHLDRTA